ncbi:hypothetical protein ACFU99_18535 [Streptomyces sp. NPDC057654]
MSGQTPTTEQQKPPEQPTTDELMRKQEELRERIEQHLAKLQRESAP